MAKITVGAIIEARMTSTRLPGKSMRLLEGKPSVLRCVERARACPLINKAVVATSVDTEDDPIADACKKNGIPCYRGSREDVLSRVLEAARANKVDVIVELGADNPLTDPLILGRLVELYLTGKYDFVSNDLDGGFPLGFQSHVFTAESLAKVDRSTQHPRDREHVNTYMRRNPQEFRQYALKAPSELRHPDWRLTMDYPEDVELITRVIRELEPKKGIFSLADVVGLLKSRPDWLKINEHCRQTVYFPGEDMKK